MSPMTSPISAKKLQWKLIRIGLSYGGGIFILSDFLFSVMIDVKLYELTVTLFVTICVLITVLLSDYIGIKYFFNPIYAHLVQLQKSSLTDEAYQDLYVRLLNFPMMTVIRIFTFHVIPSYIILIVTSSYFISLGLLSWALVEYSVLMSLLVVTVAIHAALEYYAVKRVLLPTLIHVQASVEALSQNFQRRIIRLGIYRRLLVLTAWLMLIPMTVLGITLLVRIANILYELNVDNVGAYVLPLIITAFAPVIVISGVIFIIIRNIAREISQPADMLVNAMQTVAEGNLNIHLPITTADEFANLNRGFNQMVNGLQERERLHDAFGRYVSPELAIQVREQGASLSAQELQASVMFVDIRNFTPLSEKLSATEVVNILNRFFAMVEPLIKAQGGWINKFLGDGFMVIFGAPVPYDDHAKRAVIVARQIREALATLNTQHEDEFPPLAIGIGIDCGELVAGSIGSPDRIEYTVIGDVVNVASRIESLNKELGTTILISEAVYNGAGDVGASRIMPPTQVKGKSAPVQVYALE